MIVVDFTDHTECRWIPAHRTSEHHSDELMVTTQSPRVRKLLRKAMSEGRPVFRDTKGVAMRTPYEPLREEGGVFFLKRGGTSTD